MVSFVYMFFSVYDYYFFLFLLFCICTCKLLSSSVLPFLFSIFFFFLKKLHIVVVRDVCPSVLPTVRLSVCANYFFCGNLISSRPIHLTIGLNVRQGVVHVRNAWIFKILIASYKFMQFAFFCKWICVHGFDWSTNPSLLKIDMHVRFTMMHVWKSWFFFKITIGSCKFMQLAILCK